MNNVKLSKSLFDELNKYCKDNDKDINQLTNRVLREWVTVNILDFPVVQPKPIEQPKPVEEIKKPEEPKPIIDDRDLYGE
jgi:hypothetical protein